MTRIQEAFNYNLACVWRFNDEKRVSYKKKRKKKKKKKVKI